MINLSNSAKKCLDKYLQQVRTYLRGCKTVDADEVERNVIEHIESEFATATAAVSFEELDAVLQRLGSPRQWVPEDQIPWWRKTILRLRSGPEDWRLAYISFGLLIAGFIILPSFIVLIPASFIVARAALSETEDTGELKAQKWLIYPSLIIVYLVLLCPFLALPLLRLIMLAHVWEHTIRASYNIGDDTPYWLAICSIFVVSIGLWWLILGVVSLARPNIPKVLFRPFADGFNRRWALIVLLIGLALMITSLGLGIWCCKQYRY
ncbi:MAG: HAAS signaling domain-containing protein [Planctomycetota bacterium]|jgi:hypothetical protein